MCQIILFGFVSKILVINPVAVEILAADFESVLAQVATVAKCDIRCNQMLVSMHSTVATEFQANAQITTLAASIRLVNADESAVVGVVMALLTRVMWVLSMIRGWEVRCGREVGCHLTDMLWF